MQVTEKIEYIKGKLPKEYFEDIDHGYKHSADLIEKAESLIEVEKLDIDDEVMITSILLHDIFAQKGKNMVTWQLCTLLKILPYYFLEKAAKKFKKPYFFAMKRANCFVKKEKITLLRVKYFMM